MPKIYNQIQSAWFKIPLHVKTLMYSLPLLIQWWPARYIEREKKVKDVAEVSCGYFLLFFFSILLFYFFYRFVDILPEYLHIYLYYIIYFFHNLFSFFYIVFSLLMGYENFFHKELPYQKLRWNIGKGVLGNLEKYLN